MSNLWDIAVFDRREQIVLAVDTRNLRHKGAEWAEGLHRHLAEYDNLPTSPYFLLAMPDRFYLWSNGIGRDDNHAPDYVINSAPLLRPFFEGITIDENEIDRHSFEMIVFSWLAQYVHASETELINVKDLDWLRESGLAAAIARGRITYGVLV